MLDLKPRKKDRREAFSLTHRHTHRLVDVPGPHHLFPRTWGTSVPAHNACSRQTHWSTKATFYCVLWSDNSLRKAIVCGGEVSALDQSNKRKNNTGMGYYTAVMRKIRKILTPFTFLNGAFQYVHIQGFQLLNYPSIYLCLKEMILSPKSLTFL